VVIPIAQKKARLLLGNPAVESRSALTRFGKRENLAWHLVRPHYQKKHDAMGTLFHMAQQTNEKDGDK
jgi:hypothetical protein